MGSPTCELVFTDAPARAGGRPQDGADPLRDGADERRPAGYRRAGRSGLRRSGLPRRAAVRAASARSSASTIIRVRRRSTEMLTEHEGEGAGRRVRCSTRPTRFVDDLQACTHHIGRTRVQLEAEEREEHERVQQAGGRLHAAAETLRVRSTPTRWPTTRSRSTGVRAS